MEKHCMCICNRNVAKLIHFEIGALPNKFSNPESLEVQIFHSHWQISIPLFKNQQFSEKLPKREFVSFERHLIVLVKDLNSEIKALYKL